MAFWTRFSSTFTEGMSQMSGYSNLRDTNRLRESCLFCISALEKPMSQTSSPAEKAARIELANSVAMMRSELTTRGVSLETQTSLFIGSEGVQASPRSGALGNWGYARPHVQQGL
jgi:hypothetical protein